MSSPTTPKINSRFGLFPLRSPLLWESLDWFLFLCLLRCFSSAGIASITYVFSYRWWDVTLTGFPHSESSGSKLISSSPKIFAGIRVLHRLLMPRHPPAALNSLTYNIYISNYNFLWATINNHWLSSIFLCEVIFKRWFSSVTFFISITCFKIDFDFTQN
jgi:hypothetical protein